MEYTISDYEPVPEGQVARFFERAEERGGVIMGPIRGIRAMTEKGPIWTYVAETV